MLREDFDGDQPTGNDDVIDEEEEDEEACIGDDNIQTARFDEEKEELRDDLS